MTASSLVFRPSSINEDIYCKKISASDIVLKGAVSTPTAAQKMVSVLQKRSPKNLSDPNSLKNAPEGASK